MFFKVNYKNVIKSLVTIRKNLEKIQDTMEKRTIFRMGLISKLTAAVEVDQLEKLMAIGTIAKLDELLNLPVPVYVEEAKS